MTNAADRKSIRVAEKRVKLEAEQDAGVLSILMSTTDGRAWVWRRLESACVFSTVYNESPTRMAFNEGIRNAGLELLNAVIAIAPDQFIQAMREANVRRSTADTIDRNADADRSSGDEFPGSEDAGRSDQGSDPILGGPADEGSGYIEDALH